MKAYKFDVVAALVTVVLIGVVFGVVSLNLGWIPALIAVVAAFVLEMIVLVSTGVKNCTPATINHMSWSTIIAFVALAIGSVVVMLLFLENSTMVVAIMFNWLVCMFGTLALFDSLLPRNKRYIKRFEHQEEVVAEVQKFVKYRRVAEYSLLSDFEDLTAEDLKQLRVALETRFKRPLKNISDEKLKKMTVGKLADCLA